jgi:hypothetical protein
MLIRLNVQFLLFDGAVIAANFQYISMDLVNGIILEIFALSLSLQLGFDMKIIDVLSDNAAGFASSYQFLNNLRKRHMAFVGFCFDFDFVEIAQPLPRDRWMAIEEFRCEDDLRFQRSLGVIRVEDSCLFLPEAIISSESRNAAGCGYTRSSED